MDQNKVYTLFHLLHVCNFAFLPPYFCFVAETSCYVDYVPHSRFLFSSCDVIDYIQV